MKKNNKILILLLVLVLILVGGLSVYAYQKQQSYKEVKPQATAQKSTAEKLSDEIKSQTTKFNNEKEVDKKVSILENVLNQKDKVNNEKNNVLTKLYTETVDKMKSDIRNLITDKIKEYTLSAEEQQNSEKVTEAEKKLEDLRKLIDEKKDKIYDNEQDSTAVINEIDALVVANKTAQTAQTQTQAAQEQQQEATQEQARAVQPTTPAQPVQPTAPARAVQPTTPAINNNTNTTNNTTTPTTPSTNNNTNTVVQPTTPATTDGE